MTVAYRQAKGLVTRTQMSEFLAAWRSPANTPEPPVPIPIA
jgi:hypothetical protein